MADTLVTRWSGDTWTTIGTTNASIYNSWVTNHTATTSTAGRIWVNWSTTSTSITMANSLGDYRTPPRTEERAWAQELEEGRQRRRAQLERREEASVTARAWLRSLLTPEQRECYDEHGYIDVTVASGRTYRIKRGHAGNVALMEDGREVEALCAHPAMDERDESRRVLGFLPNEDVMVAQLLALRHDEEGFRATANITNYRHGHYEPLAA